MANTLSKAGITTGATVETWHVTQSIDALTATEAYDISLSGSFNMTGSINGKPGTINNLTASFAVSSSRTISSSFATTSITSSYIQSSTLNQDLTVNGSFFISSSITHLSPRYVTTTNDTITDIYNFGSAAIGRAQTIETMILGVTASAGGLSASTGTTGGNYMGVFSVNETSKILGETSSSFTRGFATAGTPGFGLRYSGPGISSLRFFVKGLPNETINWVVSIRILGN